MAVAALVLPLTANAERHVRFTGDFESGQVRDLSSRVDGFRIRTLPDPQLAGEIAIVSKGGAGPASGIDTRVVSDELVGLELVRPRRGGYFIRSALHKSKDYSELQNGKNKPRSAINMSGSDCSVDFDEEGYLGFSIFLPKNWEHERGVAGNRGESQLLQVQSQGASWTLLRMGIFVPSGETKAHWMLTHYYSDESTKIDGGSKVYDLGPVTRDLGKWTDFVLRYRFNPFSKTTNASSISGGRDKVYQGNKGILQLWKSTGTVDGSGNRKMKLTSVNLENEPVGLVPHADSNITWSFRVYKYGWHRNPTTVKGPVWVGFDEIRDGRTLADGTTYSDVHPAGLACTDQCPTGSRSGIEPLDDDKRPRPPKNLSIADGH